MPKSLIKKGIIRNINTDKFEQVTISVEIEEEVEWKNGAERQKKADIVSKMLLDDFKKTYNEVITTIGVDRCIGVVTVLGDSADKIESEPEIENKSNVKVNEKKDDVSDVDGEFDF